MKGEDVYINVYNNIKFSWKRKEKQGNHCN
jgi:hypothetical protein